MSVVMNRRQLFPLLSTPFALRAQESGCRIEAIEIHELQGTREAESGVNGQYQVQPLHIYPS
jgi:hypothetical protein